MFCNAKVINFHKKTVLNILFFSFPSIIRLFFTNFAGK